MLDAAPLTSTSSSRIHRASKGVTSLWLPARRGRGFSERLRIPRGPTMFSTMLVGRREECRQLDELLSGVRRGISRTLVIRGEAGIGKSALLEYLIGRDDRYRVVQAAGVQAEAELAFAALHQLCTPLLDR